MNKKWTKEEEQFLIDNKDADWEFLATHLNKTEKIVRSKFHRMGLTRPSVGWSNEEIDFLKNHYHDGDWDLLCDTLRRKKGTIKAKATSMGLYVNKRWTKAEIEDLKSLYANSSYEYLEMYFDRKFDNIKAKAKSLGLKRNTSKRKWTDDENNFILKNYHDMTCAEMGKYLDRSAVSVQTHLQHVGLSQEHSRYYLGKAQYKFKRDYFDCIDSIDKAYWFGFLWGDGWIGKWGVGCSIQVRDIDHLKKLNKSLNGNVPVREFFEAEHFSQSLNRVIPDYTGAEIRLYSKKLSDALKNYGMEYHNTYNHCNFPNIADELKIHFIRGLFDADGSVSLSSWQADVCCGCNRELFLDIRQFLYDNYGIKSNLQEKKGKNCLYYQLRCMSSQDTLKFGKAIYEGSQQEHFIYLERKYRIFVKRIE